MLRKAIDKLCDFTVTPRCLAYEVREEFDFPSFLIAAEMERERILNAALEHLQ